MVVSVELIEPVTPDVPVEPLVEPAAPMEPVPPEDDVSLLVVPGVVPAVLPVVAPVLSVVVELPAVPPAAGVLLLLEVDVSLLGAGAGVVVDELEDDVVGAGVVSSRSVQAPSVTAAMSVSAANEIGDAFIGKLLEGVVRKSSSRGGHDRPIGTLGTPHTRLVGSCRRCV